MITAAGASVSTIDHEFFAGQSRQPRLFVQKLGTLDQFVPGGGWLHVDVDHPRVGRDAKIAQPWIARRLVAFQQHRAMQFLGGGLDGRDQFQIILDPLQRRHEQVQPPFPRLGTERGARQPGGGLVNQRCPVIRDRCRVMALQLLSVGQRREILIRVQGVDERILRRLDPRLRSQRQAIAQRRVPRHQSAMLVAQVPAATLPAVARGSAGQWQHLADDFIQALAEYFTQACTLQRILQP
ncbi:hypothetical protein D3C73_824390 [compost metagenome]